MILKKNSPSNTNKLLAKKPDEDFIPYVCHFSPDTILTKNGELLQIIRVTGFINESGVSDLISLRDAVRDAISEHVQDDKFAFWFNTIRRKKNISPKGEFKDFFSKKVNDDWDKKNDWRDQYVNELYITVITEGIDTSITNLNSFFRSFSYYTTKSLHQGFLDKAHQKLSAIVNNILKDIKPYGAKLLGIKDWDGVLYSEPMRFFGKIVNLYEERYPLSANDISNDLASHKVAFGDRELEVVGYENKNFATMLSLKEYFELPLSALDKILQLPFEFIITQSFDFVYSKKEIEPYEYQNYILQVSGDEDFRQLSGVAGFVENTKNPLTDYGKLQTTVMLISENQKELEKDVRVALEQFSALGFVIVREDVFSEHCFWSQLPGNFRYLCRQKVISTSRIAGFAALYNFPSGLIAGNHWGPAVSAFRTVLNTPYFFNFHEDDLGNTLIVGPKNSGKTVLLNFLLTQARRFDGKLFYFDFESSAKCFTKAMSGSYYSLESHDVNNPEFLRLNPIIIADKSKENKALLADFFASLVAFIKDPIPQNEIDFIPQIIDQIFASNASSLKEATEFFKVSETKNIYEKLQVWSGEKLGYIFGAGEEIKWSDKIITFNLAEVYEQKPVLIPLFNYLLQKVEASLDKTTPSIIVINEAWDVLDNKILAPKMAEFLKRMKEKNCIVVFVSSDTDYIADSDFFDLIKDNIATEIFMPNQNPKQFYQDIFGLNDEEVEILRVMEDGERHFLLKHGEDSVIAALDLSKMPEIFRTLSAGEVEILAMDEVIKAIATEEKPIVEPSVWLPHLFEVLQEINREEEEENKRLLRERKAEERRIAREKYRS